jgi:hypothetical protein
MLVECLVWQFAIMLVHHDITLDFTSTAIGTLDLLLLLDMALVSVITVACHCSCYCSCEQTKTKASLAILAASGIELLWRIATLLRLGLRELLGHVVDDENRLDEGKEGPRGYK